MAETAPDFRFDPDSGAYLSSYGAKGSGKSELAARLFATYPYNGLVIDHTGDFDPEGRMTEELSPDLKAIANQIGGMKNDLDEMTDDEIDELLATYRAAAIEAWHGDPPQRYRKYRFRPNFMAKDWLDRSDNVVALAYLVGHCCVVLDEVGIAAPANRTPRFTRQALHMGRHQRLSMLMPGPRPADLDPLVLNQSDVVTVHGPLHPLDIQRLAKHFGTSDRELASILESLQHFERADSPLYGVGEFLVYFQRERDLAIYPPLPPRK
jgi:hypothetical protein